MTQPALDFSPRDTHVLVRMLPSPRGSEHGNMPRLVGGRRPPQLRMLRQFGVRAFRGASMKRQAAVDKATPVETPADHKG